MLLPAVKKIYDDSMILEKMIEISERVASIELGAIISIWEETSREIEELIPRVAEVDIDEGRRLLKAWEYVREEKEDYRELLFRIENELIPELLNSINDLYGPIVLENGSLCFEKTLSGFITVKNLETRKYIHSPSNPMLEASKLAEMLYDPKMDAFHILGCGLGYLPYQIWEKSDRSSHIYVYEEDSSICEYADQMGVLSWIDEEYLTIISYDDTEKLIEEFVNNCDEKKNNYYISDWKVGSYKQEIIDAISFDNRTKRGCEKLWTINLRENNKLLSKKIEDLAKDLKQKKSEFVVVSAGPSLNENIDFIKKSVGNRTIISVNTAFRRLVNEKIKPDIVVMLDPKKELKNQIVGIEDYTEGVPLVMTINASRTFASAYRGPKYTISDDSETGDGFRWRFGGTVASLGIDLAYYLDAQKIFLVGSDLAFSGGDNYADGVSHEKKEGINNEIIVESSDGGTVKTNNLYSEYRKMIEQQIACHPEITIVNLAKHGAKIKGTIS